MSDTEAKSYNDTLESLRPLLEFRLAQYQRDLMDREGVEAAVIRGRCLELYDLMELPELERKAAAETERRLQEQQKNERRRERRFGLWGRTRRTTAE